ncbi:hypothetical protein COLO4_24934 [Corchorus olitorius]|uniref:Axoneme-associated protein MST101(2) protein n=1 Tax=Corchorus olitorius TaxID=93759 RepID=A0A1R3I5X7_9ROSI|nr:hypothetical protein COLO4_24934 [Corchorus olitorius]
MTKKDKHKQQMDGGVDDRLNVRNIMKDIEFLGSSHMTWKERKQLENKKVVSLGGKPPKKQRLPLSVARAVMKNQKKREEKMLKENMILGQFRGKLGGGAKRSEEKRRPEDRVLRSSEGNFKNGVLNVKHFFQKSPAQDNDSGGQAIHKGKKKKGGGKKNRGKKKGGGGGGRKRH